MLNLSCSVVILMLQRAKPWAYAGWICRQAEQTSPTSSREMLL